jgi:hypothetical protein
MKLRWPHGLVLFLFLILTLSSLTLADEVRVRPYRAYCASVTDTTVIREFLQQQSIPTTEQTDSLEIIDATGNGFGENDLVIVYPSKQTYSLMTIEEPLKSMMKDWRYNAEQLTSPDTTSAQLFEDARADSTGKGGFKGLLAFILKGLELYYGGNTVEGAFRRDQNSSYLELLNYNKDALKYRKLETAALSDTVHSYDLLQIVSRDTLVESDSTMYDVIYVYKTLHDTVYLPADAPPADSKHAK